MIAVGQTYFLELDLTPLFNELTLDEKFGCFHAENPEVYTAIVRLARSAKARSFRHSMKAIFEKLRWDFRERTDGGEFKLNNSFTSRYARMVMRREPDLCGFFETRGMEGD